MTITVEALVADDLIADIAEAALSSNVPEDGAEDPFRSVEAWIGWCLDGSDGRTIRAIAHARAIDAEPLMEAFRHALRHREFADLNEPWLAGARRRVAAATNLDEVYERLMHVHHLVGDSGMQDRSAFGYDAVVPVFGPDPSELDDVWSWDEHYLLKQDHPEEFRLRFVARDGRETNRTA